MYPLSSHVFLLDGCCPPMCLSVLRDRNFTLDTILRNKILLYMPCFGGSFDFDHFLPFSVTLTLAGGHKVSRKQNLLTHFLAHFSPDQNRNCSDEVVEAEHPVKTSEQDLCD